MQTIFEGTYLKDGWIDLGCGRCPIPLNVSHETVDCFTGYFCLATTEVHMFENRVFLVPVKYTLVCCTPRCIAFLGHITHYHVS